MSRAHTARVFTPFRAMSGPRSSLPCRAPGCSYVARSNFLLRQHITSHSEERRFPCESAGCGKAFKTAATLWRHHGRVHADRDGESFPSRICCPTCDASYRRDEFASTHVPCPLAGRSDELFQAQLGARALNAL